jgi:UDP-N-acetylmuramoyl-tripeptide--D-alanyl-D-alanine ligase
MVDSVKISIPSEEVARAIGGRVTGKKDGVVFSGISTDSRTISAGELFFALTGDTFDGHDFVPDAIKRGAGGVVIEKNKHRKIPEGCVAIEVGDTLTALGDLAGHHREKQNLISVGITGSNGKTTTKEITHLVLSHKYRCKKSEGNFNNLIGLPLMLLSVGPDDEAVVLEMGMNVPGEMKRLSDIARPNIGVITNIGPVHLEGVGDIAGVIREKGELVKNLPADATAIINGDCEYSRRLIDDIGARLLTFAIERDADVTATDIEDLGHEGIRARFRLPSGEFKAKLRIPGAKNLHNALAAAAVGEALGVPPDDIKKAIESARAVAMRMEIIEAPENVTILNDTYNANPVSVMASLDFLKGLSEDRPGRLIAVLGDMLELGDYTKKGHEEVGEKAAHLGFSLLFLLGTQIGHAARGAASVGLDGKNIKTYGPDKHERLARDLRERIRPGDLILIKGSRGMKMERITQLITKPREG